MSGHTTPPPDVPAPPPTPHPRRFRYPPNNAKVLMRLVDLLVVHTQRGPFAIWQCMVSF